jgi:hypothetical protein
MLSCEIKVNGNLVGHIYARNVTGEVSPDQTQHLYHWEYYRPESRKVRNGIVSHIRRDGIEQLISIILAEVDK